MDRKRVRGGERERERERMRQVLYQKAMGKVRPSFHTSDLSPAAASLTTTPNPQPSSLAPSCPGSCAPLSAPVLAESSNSGFWAFLSFTL